MLTYDDVPNRFNITGHFLDGRLEAGDGDRRALIVATHIPESGDEPPTAQTYTYAELARLTDRIGNALKELGVCPEERVLLALADGAEFLATWFAVLKIGAIAAEVYTFLQPDDYDYYLNYTRAKVVIVDETTRQKIGSIAGRSRHLVHRLVVNPATDLTAGELDFSALVRQAADQLDPEDTRKDDIAIWKFTTGSTGLPKAAVHCHYSPLINFACHGQNVIGYRRDDIVLPIPKLFFGYARDHATLYPLGTGATSLIFPERTTADRIFQLVRHFKPTILVQVPTMMNSMVNHPEVERHDLSSLRFCISSGEALPTDLELKWRDTFGVEIINVLGSSEMYGPYVAGRHGLTKPGSAGRPVPGYEVQVVDPDGRSLPANQVGEIWVRGDSSAIMYWGDRRKSQRTFVGDWVHTGDIAEQDAEGYLWFRGRVDDLLKIGGIWVAPLEVENCLLQHPGVQECAVVGYEQDNLVLPRAYVVMRDQSAGSAESAKDLQDFVRAKLSPHKYPRDVVFAEHLPKTASGKIDRQALKASAGRSG